MEETVWDQHMRYFEARGETCDRRTMFNADLIYLLRRWKAAGDKILLMGDFKKDVYTNPLAMSLTLEELPLSKLCYRSTGVMLSPTHTRLQSY
jgi:hypothetical protein